MLILSRIGPESDRSSRKSIFCIYKFSINFFFCCLLNEYEWVPRRFTTFRPYDTTWMGNMVPSEFVWVFVTWNDRNTSFVLYHRLLNFSNMTKYSYINQNWRNMPEKRWKTFTWLSKVTEICSDFSLSLPLPTKMYLLFWMIRKNKFRNENEWICPPMKFATHLQFLPKSEEKRTLFRSL